MDAQRFDNLARTLASRLSRRNALRRAGAVASASLLAATGIRPEQAAALLRAQNDSQRLFTLMRRYTLGVPAAQVRQVLMQGYVEDACQAPGFVAYLTIEDEDGDFVTVAVFQSQQDLVNFTNAEATWIAQNLDNLLPAPDEAISGETYVHAAAPQGFPNTCSASPAPPALPASPAAAAPPTDAAQTAAPAQPTAPPAQPTAAPAQPTAVPTGPPPPPAPACTAQGCVCTTGTQAPCDAGLVCCPTTDLMGGPGVCQPENVCYPNQCLANGTACPSTCGTTDACTNCCTNWCNENGVCDTPPPACTASYCPCTPGAAGTCDSGLVCCTGTSSIGPVCGTAAQCASIVCPHQYCGCQTGVDGACDDGLVCCTSTGTAGGPGVCLSPDECNPTCNGQGCGCSGGVQGACDDGFVCCQNGAVITGGAGTCQPEGQCAPPACTGEGCTCISGAQDACDDGLMCCAQGDPGVPGTCQVEANCAASLCTGEGCACNAGAQNACADGLVCCQTGGSIPVCVAEAECAPPCTSDGGACDTSCNWGDACAFCCSGYCNPSGVCDEWPATTCISDGVNCGSTCTWSDACDACCSGFCDGAGNCNQPGASAGACGDEGCGCELANPACVEGLFCCDDGSGVTGTCEAGC